MKKLIAAILILCLLMTAAALADDDPIIGAWYMYLDCALYPEMAANFGNVDSEISIYYFTESGAIYLLDCSIKGGSSTPTFAVCGKWSKDGNLYNYSIVALGESTCTVDGDILNLGYPGSQFSMKLHKVIPFNPYADYSY